MTVDNSASNAYNEPMRYKHIRTLESTWMALRLLAAMRGRRIIDVLDEIVREALAKEQHAANH